MCGIVGYIGHQQAAAVLLEGLSKLEYRGYDSAGICVHTPHALTVSRSKGRLQTLREKCNSGADLPGTLGIGHTRWATHGAPSDCNAHPHRTEDGKIALVHNGIIENYLELKEELLSRGHRFTSETDTEVAACLLGENYAKTGDMLSAILATTARLTGSYALGILCVDHPDRMYAVKKDSPLILGWGDKECLIASDTPAILGHTRRVIHPADGDIAILTDQSIQIFDAQGHPVLRPTEEVQWSVADAELGDYPHFMLKEIMEQPRVLTDTATAPLTGNSDCTSSLLLNPEQIRNLRRIYITACGSAYHVGFLGKYILEKYCRIPTESIQASEFRYAAPILDKNTLVVLISQSGETADTLAALREAKAQGAHTLAIVNVIGSAIAKAADEVIYTCAGPEIAVATTKAYSAQLAVMYRLALRFAQLMETQSQEDIQQADEALVDLPRQIEQTLLPERIGQMRTLADRFHTCEDIFFIGRNVDAVTCLEGSLKLKELSYIHAEAYPAGELKHGPISLIEEGVPVIALATVEELFHKTMANVKEVKARGATVICLTTPGYAEEARQTADVVVEVPKTHPLLQPSVNIVPLQLFSYFTALNRGCDVDKPRNLAKSVTVE